MQTTLENQTANNHAAREDYVAPNVNIFETQEGYVLEAEMPGVGKEGLDVTLEGTEITITGRRSPETVTGQPLFRERNTADYRRVFELDPAIDTAKVSAKVTQGILTVTLPKSERVKPRKIAVN
ncbi:MAG TPA: Hsp20/alpha crystallin family protein [Verrucomicrobiae bacterium]|jgi:HSP20 family protein|nr:Hsp20/alpha crystallin family protein [Verrucomicrobiae bacterium]